MAEIRTEIDWCPNVMVKTPIPNDPYKDKSTVWLFFKLCKAWLKYQFKRIFTNHI